jgi:hypothetical protein
MMTTSKYILTSEHFDGELVLEYNLDDVLVRFDNRAALNEAQLTWLSGNFPLTVDAANSLLQRSKLKATVVPADLGFEVFWDAYDYKAYSNRKLCLKLWDKLSHADRIAVLLDIPKYENRLIKQPGVAKKYAETYLRSEVWKGA